VTPRAALAALLIAAAPGCGSAATRIPVDAPAALAPMPKDEVARQVGLLLSADPQASRAAERALLSLDEDGRRALEEHARRIPTERDPRWRNVLDEHGLLPASSVEERVDLLLWKASRPDPVMVLKAQNGLLDLARKDPSPLLARLRRPGPGRDVVAVTLAHAGVRPAVPALLDLYRTGEKPEERRAASAALGRLAGDSLQPRVEGTPAERERDAQLVESWYRRAEAHDASVR
jgi:hypothetical protein